MKNIATYALMAFWFTGCAEWSDSTGAVNDPIVDLPVDNDQDGYDNAAADCDDNDPSTYPGAPELCDGKDNNCDGTADEGGVCEKPDSDNDGSPDDVDCNDFNNTVYPSAPELCDGIDNDCDSSVDEDPAPNAVGAFVVYQDGDGDGYGFTNTSKRVCGPVSGFVTQPGDCRDDLRSANPGVVQDICAAGNLPNGIDENCNGQVDEGCTGSTGGNTPVTCFLDQDGDGFGLNPTAYTEQSGTCPTSPQRYVTQGNDCNDGNGNVNPSRTEVPNNGLDDDCDASTPDNTGGGSTPVTCYHDYDGDTWGNSNAPLVFNSGSCGAGYVLRPGDCRDDLNVVNPGGTEVPNNGLDDDCNPSTPDMVSPGTVQCYNDYDGDRVGAVGSPITQHSGSCPSGTVNVVGSSATDCNDLDASIQTGCSGGGTVVCYTDLDNDGYGVGSPQTVVGSSCGYQLASVAGDCNDNNPNVFTGCNNASVTCYTDHDEDDYSIEGGSAQVFVMSTCPSGYIASNTNNDCDDSDVCDGDDCGYRVNPGMDEVIDGLDNDCDGEIDDCSDCRVELELWYRSSGSGWADIDGDSWPEYYSGKRYMWRDGSPGSGWYRASGVDPLVAYPYDICDSDAAPDEVDGDGYDCEYDDGALEFPNGDVVYRASTCIAYATYSQFYGGGSFTLYAQPVWIENEDEAGTNFDYWDTTNYQNGMHHSGCEEFATVIALGSDLEDRIDDAEGTSFAEMQSTPPFFDAPASSGSSHTYDGTNILIVDGDWPTQASAYGWDEGNFGGDQFALFQY